MAALGRESHYVRQSYLRRWLAPSSSKLWAYRTLVPRPDFDVWEESSPWSVARRRDFYTSVEGPDKESDRIERWLNDEVENPAIPVLDKLCRGEALTAKDRRKLARYIASLDARHPLHYLEYTALMSQHVGGVIDSMLEEQVKDLTHRVKNGLPLPEVPKDYKSHSIGVVFDHGDEATGEDPTVSVNLVIGREGWLDSIEHLVNDVSRFLEPHDWHVVRPHAGWTWYSSDHPVVRLRFNGLDKYDLKGRYGDPGTEIMLPLSPHQLLYTQAARSPKLGEALSLEQTCLVKRFIAENAFRWVISANQVRHAAWFRPRIVNRDQFNFEENEREKFHEEQKRAELEVTNAKRPAAKAS